MGLAGKNRVVDEKKFSDDISEKYSKQKLRNASLKDDRNVSFEYMFVKSFERLKSYILVCEGKHFQQVVYSTHQDVHTQICFDCKKIRSTFRR